MRFPSQEPKQHPTGSNWAETQTRLTNLAHRYLHRGRCQTALLPLGMLLELIECHWQHAQLSSTSAQVTIDVAIPQVFSADMRVFSGWLTC